MRLYVSRLNGGRGGSPGSSLLDKTASTKPLDGSAALGIACSVGRRPSPDSIEEVSDLAEGDWRNAIGRNRARWYSEAMADTTQVAEGGKLCSVP